MVFGGAAILLGDMLLGIVGVALGAVALIVTVVLGWGGWRDRRFRRRHTEAGRAERRREEAVRSFKRSRPWKRGKAFRDRKSLTVDDKGVVSVNMRGAKRRKKWWKRAK